MSLTATSRSIPGTLRQEIVIDGKHRLSTDEPVEVGGEGSAPAPHELLPAALASCVSTTLVMYANRKGWQVGTLSVDVDYDHQSTPRHCDVSINVGGDLSTEQIAVLDRVAAACPVRRAIETGIEFSERIIRKPETTIAA